jgi:TPR repeat protein
MTAAEPMTVAPAGPLAGEPDLFHEIENRNEQGVGVDPAETAFAAALASAAAPPADKEISDFMAHARRVAQNASLAELAQPERPWNMRWLAWGGALLVALLICTGVLMTSGAFGGSAGANPVLRVSGETHRRPAAGGIAHVIALADSGDAGAQTLLALDYLKGNGVPSDAEAAQRWSLAAANQGQPVAQYVLGTLYLQADPNDSQAVRWFRAAADQGNVKAMHNLGIAFAQGQGVDKNPEEAVKWFTRAAAQGYRDSEFDLAVLYERGLGAPQSARAALKWYLIAAANGDAPSAARAKFLQEQVDPMIYRLAAQDAASFAAKPAGKAANETPDL